MKVMCVQRSCDVLCHHHLVCSVCNLAIVEGLSLHPGPLVVTDCRPLLWLLLRRLLWSLLPRWSRQGELGASMSLKRGANPGFKPRLASRQENGGRIFVCILETQVAGA